MTVHVGKGLIPRRVRATAKQQKEQFGEQTERNQPDPAGPVEEYGSLHRSDSKRSIAAAATCSWRTPPVQMHQRRRRLRDVVDSGIAGSDEDRRQTERQRLVARGFANLNPFVVRDEENARADLRAACGYHLSIPGVLHCHGQEAGQLSMLVTIEEVSRRGFKRPPFTMVTSCGVEGRPVLARRPHAPLRNDEKTLRPFPQFLDVLCSDVGLSA
jgi:hypothetical protein